MKVAFLVHETPGADRDALSRDVDAAIRSCGLSGIGVEGMSEYAVLNVEIDTDLHPLPVSVELEWIGGQFVGRKEMTDLLMEAAASIDEVGAAEAA